MPVKPKKKTKNDYTWVTLQYTTVYSTPTTKAAQYKNMTKKKTVLSIFFFFLQELGWFHNREKLCSVKTKKKAYKIYN